METHLHVSVWCVSLFGGSTSFHMLSLQWFETRLCVSCDTFMTLRAEAAGVKQGDMGKLQ